MIGEILGRASCPGSRLHQTMRSVMSMPVKRNLRLESAGAHDKVVEQRCSAREGKQVPRQLGALRGRIWIAPDFDEFPAESLSAMEAEAD